MRTALNLKKRIEKIADQYAATPIMVLVAMPDGTQKVMDVSNMILHNLTLIRVISGNSLRDLDRIIEYGYNEAYRYSDETA